MKIQTLKCIALALFLPFSALADSYFVQPTTGASLPADQLAGINELVRMSVPGVNNSTLANSPAEADFLLQPAVVKLGQAFILRISKTKSGKIVFQEQARSNSIEDMDTVAGRVARAVITETSFENNAKVSDVTEDEVTRGKRRIKAINQTYFAFGPGRVWALNTDKTAVDLEFGRSWGIDSHFGINLSLQGMFFPGVTASFLSLQTSLDYSLTEGNYSPYLSVGTGYAWTYADWREESPISNRSAGGFLVSGGVGLKMFRTSEFNLGVSAKYVYVFEENSLGNPSTLIGALTLYY